MKQATVLSLLIWYFCSCASESEHVNNMYREHAVDAPVSNELSEVSVSVTIDSKMVDYATMNGHTAKGYLSRPSDSTGPFPGIIVIHEWWGLNDNIRSMTDQLAAAGYQALAVDLYNGRLAETPEDARRLMSASLENRDVLTENVRQAYSYLSSQKQKVGTIGWCFGGGWSLNTAIALPEDIDATVIYYGRLVSERDVLQPLKMPILGFFGGLDQGISLKSVSAFEEVLIALGKEVDIRIYDDADHAFANPSGTNYQAGPAKEAWEETLAFFHKHLKS